MGKKPAYKGGRKLIVKEMIPLEEVYEVAKRCNALRLWRSWWEMTQTDLAMKLDVHPGAVAALERYGLKAFEGEYGEKYKDSLELALQRLEERFKATPKSLGLQFEGLPTRFSKKNSE